MNMNEWVKKTIDDPQKKPIPVLSFAGAKLCSVTVKEMLQDADIQACCLKAVADTFDTAAALSPMDLSLEAEALGCRIEFKDWEVPAVRGCLIKSEADLAEIISVKACSGRMAIFLEAMAKAKKKYRRQAVFCRCDRPVFTCGKADGCY